MNEHSKGGVKAGNKCSKGRQEPEPKIMDTSPELSVTHTCSPPVTETDGD